MAASADVRSLPPADRGETHQQEQHQHQHQHQPPLEQLLDARQWQQAVQAARARVSADSGDAAAWWALARALLRGLREPEAAYTACCRALRALEQPRRGGGVVGQPPAGVPPAQQLAALRFECLSAVARGDSNAVRARWAQSGLAGPPDRPGISGCGGSRSYSCSSNRSGGDPPAARARSADHRGCAGRIGEVDRTGGQPAAPQAYTPRCRVFVLSDLHADAVVATHGSRNGVATHMDLLRRISATRFQHDVLLVAGDVADTLPAIREALRLLKERFGRVFFVPGNHCLWLRPGLEEGSLPDSFCKLWALQAACDELGVETVAAEVAPGVLVAPLLSWYSAAFDLRDPRPGRLRFDSWCRWPVSDLDVWQVMLRLNDPVLAAMGRWRCERMASQARSPHSAPSQRKGSTGPAGVEKDEETDEETAEEAEYGQLSDRFLGSSSKSGGGGGGSPAMADLGQVVPSGWGHAEVVITMTHFLPHPGLPFPRIPNEMAKAVGCGELMVLLDTLGADVHVYGHTHIAYDAVLRGGVDSKERGIQTRSDDPQVAGSRERVEGQAGCSRRYVHWPLHGQLNGPVLRCVWDGEGLCHVDVDAGG